MREYGLYINGQMVPADTGETFDVVSPYSGDVVGKAARGRESDINHAVRAARQAFDHGPWPRMSGEERSRILQQLADKIKENAKLLTEIMIAESGSTARKAKGEVHVSAKQMGYFAELAKMDLTEEIQGLSKPGISKNLMVREPIGVCGQIIPWNFPLSMFIWKIGPALAAGNTVILKPAEETPLLAMEMARLASETELPAGVLNIVTGFGEEAGEPLVKHPDVDKIAFTGSTEVGKRIMQLAAGTMKRVTLECGGKSANIVLDDADLQQAVDGSLYAAFFNSGQCCEAGTRVFLQEGIYSDFLKKFAEKTQAMQLGDPAKPETDMGPLISKKQQERVLKYIELGKNEGATCITGGKAPERSELQNGCFVEPTVFIDVENHMHIAREEIFGPVICVFKFKTLDEVVEQANDSIYGLGGAVWTQDKQKAMEVATRLRTGTVWVNDYHLISEKAPFGGYKQSGLGRELGVEGLKAYTEVKHIHIDEINNREKKFWYDSVLAPQPVGAPSA